MARAKGNVIIDEFYCKGCELCVSVCPKDILALDETRLNISGYNPVWSPIWANVSPVRTALRCVRKRPSQ